MESDRVTPEVTRPEPWDDENYPDEFQYECDLCALGPEKDESIKTVKHKFGAILCKPCFIETKKINR